MEKEVLYGIDPGSIENPEKVINLSEDLLYIIIHDLIASILCAWHATKNDEVPLDLSEDYKALEFCIYQTRKFGVDIPEAKPNKHVELTESFELWDDFWEQHFDSLTDEELAAYKSAVRYGRNAVKYLPKESFTEYQEKTKKIIRK